MTFTLPYLTLSYPTLPYTLGSGLYANLGVLGGHKKASVLFLAHPCEK